MTGLTRYDVDAPELEDNPLCATLCRAPKWCHGCPIMVPCHVLSGTQLTDPRYPERVEKYNASVRNYKESRNHDGT
jgi:hypothetical protein